jgi:hypothetical protein
MSNTFKLFLFLFDSEMYSKPYSFILFCFVLFSSALPAISQVELVLLLVVFDSPSLVRGALGIVLIKPHALGLAPFEDAVGCMLCDPVQLLGVFNCFNAVIQ